MNELSWTAVEDLVLAALQAQLGDAVKTLKSYQGNWQEDLRREGWRLPAVLVGLEESRTEQVGPSSYDLTLNLRILVMVRSLRGEDAARRAPGGVYSLLAGIRQALWHQDWGQPMLPLALVGEEPLLNSQEHTVYAALYRTALVQDF
ncbi:MAG: DUF1834 family protein [Deltaproteobacteria bacterium]|nr:DUF1834 family protein [Deltaproteobacteria bacterium]